MEHLEEKLSRDVDLLLLLLLCLLSLPLFSPFSLATNRPRRPLFNLESEAPE